MKECDRILRIHNAALSRLALILAFGSACSCSQNPEGLPDNRAETAPGHARRTTDIEGIVIYSGPPVPRKIIDFGSDEYCKRVWGDKLKVQEEIILTGKSLANALVYIKSNPNLPKLQGRDMKPVILEHYGCILNPRVTALLVQQPLIIENADPILHNVRLHVTSNPEFHGHPPRGRPNTLTFSTPEVGIQCVCDVHPWERAYVHVFDHRFFAITGLDGKFKIKEVPLGKHSLVIWHELLGEKTIEIVLPRSSRASLVIEYKDQGAQRDP